MLHIQLLGDFRITYQDRSLSGFDSPRLQSLLAFLLLHRDAPQPRKHLAFLLWTDSSEQQALNNLRNLLHRLRAALPEAERFLTADAQTLLWRSDAPFTCDAADFQALLSSSEPTIHNLTSAVALYRGELLPACYDEWLLPEREQLREMYIDALARLIQLLEQARDYRTAIGYARRLLQADPLREEGYRELMRLHALNGDRADMVRVYQSCVAVLKQELNAEPSVLTRELFEQLRRAAVLERDSMPRGRAVNDNLPVQLTSFIGRVREMRDLTALLLDKRLVTLAGAGGSGKTRLAIQLAKELVAGDSTRTHSFANGVWFVDLAALSDPALVAQTVATTLNVREWHGHSFTETLVDYLQSKEVLLVLDNCEHLLTACSELAAVLLRTCPHIKILATSREPLKVAGEMVWVAPSLSLPNKRRASPENLADSDAVQLFIERASAVLLTFTVTTRNAQAVADICHRLDGIPLAIELAAARVRTLTPTQIAARLGDSLTVLTRGTLNLAARHQTMRATMDWSYDSLSLHERVLFRRLSVFAGGFTLEAAELVSADDGTSKQTGISSPQVLDLLSELIDKSLVAVMEREQDTEARYRLLEPIRQYSREKLSESGELEGSSRRHLDFFLAFAEEAEPKLRGQAQRVWLDRLEGEHDNLRAALAWSLAREDARGVGLQLAGSLVWFWRLRDHLEEGRRWLETALQAIGGDTRSRAKALYGAGTITSFQFQNETARSYLVKSVELWQKVDDKEGLAYALGQLARVAWDEGRYDEWRALNEQTLPLFRELGDKWGLALTLSYFGAVADPDKDLARARVNLEEGIALWRELGDRWEYALALINLGEVARQEGNYQQAAGYYEESMTLIRELGNQRDLLIPLHNFGHVLNRIGEYRRAAQQFRQGLTLSLEMADRTMVAACLVGLAGAAGGEGKWVESARLFGAGAAMFELASRRLDPIDASDYEYNLARVQAQLDSTTFAAAWTQGRLTILAQDPERAVDEAVRYASQEYAEPPIENVTATLTQIG